MMIEREAEGLKARLNLMAQRTRENESRAESEVEKLRREADTLRRTVEDVRKRGLGSR